MTNLSLKKPTPTSSNSLKTHKELKNSEHCNTVKMLKNTHLSNVKWFTVNSVVTWDGRSILCGFDPVNWFLIHNLSWTKKLVIIFQHDGAATMKLIWLQTCLHTCPRWFVLDSIVTGTIHRQNNVCQESQNTRGFLPHAATRRMRGFSKGDKANNPKRMVPTIYLRDASWDEKVVTITVVTGATV